MSNRIKGEQLCGPEKSARIDLGLALLHAVRIPHIRYTRDEIAAWCGCTDSAIFLIEQQVRAKLYRRCVFSGDPVLRELMEHYAS